MVDFPVSERISLPFSNKAQQAAAVALVVFQSLVCLLRSSHIFISSTALVLLAASVNSSISKLCVSTGDSYQKYPCLFVGQYIPKSSDCCAVSNRDFSIC